MPTRDRLTQSDLYELVQKLNSLGEDIDVNFHAAGGRITTQTRDLSPRLKLRELMTWLEGFYEGYIKANAQAAKAIKPVDY